MRRSYIAEGREDDDDGVPMPIVVIDGVGDFPAEELDAVVKSLLSLQTQIRKEQRGSGTRRSALPTAFSIIQNSFQCSGSS